MYPINKKMIPQINPAFRMEILDSNSVLILGAGKRSILKGKKLVKVVETVDGRRKVDEIHDLLSCDLNEADIERALCTLLQRGYVGFDSHLQNTVEATFWEILCGNGSETIDSLPTTPVSILTMSGFDESVICQILRNSGLAIVDNAPIHILVCSDYLCSELTKFLSTINSTSTSYLLVNPTGTMPSIGPVINQQHGCCPSCLQYWCRRNRPVEGMLEKLNRASPYGLPRMITAASQSIIFSLLSVVLQRIQITDSDPWNLDNGMLTLDLQSLNIRRHHVQKRPQCLLCGTPTLIEEQANTYPELRSVVVEGNNENGFRSTNPAQTYERYKHLISPITGAVAYVQEIKSRLTPDRKAHVSGYLVCPESISMTNTFDKTCAGKGQTEAQSRTSALCESLERLSGVYQGEEYRIRSTLKRLDGRGIHFNALQNFSDRQFAERDSINACSDDPRRKVPQPFTEETEIDWTPAWSLVSKNKHYVPLTYCYSEAPAASGLQYGIHNPNGSAAGCNIEEAVLQGLFELIERDAVSIWWYNRIERPGVDLRCYDNSFFSATLASYQSLGWNVSLLDLTHDLRVPTYAAVAHKPDDQQFSIGFGTHLDAHIAISRALTEMNQLFDLNGAAVSPWDNKQLANTNFLFPVGPLLTPSPSSISHKETHDLRHYINDCVNRLTHAGMETFVVNKTRPDIGLSVVQVIVPGLRHFWPRFGTGRLYDVPLQTGWKATPSKEEELNPASLFL